tara:strand:- start:109 stop:1077 length:969 start_codon:yes stop_codon:yes gene_type:complete
MGDIASINFKPVKANSTRHNERIGELDYVYSDLTQNNESWKVDEINKRYDAIAKLTKEKTGRKIQAKATPIREAVLNLSAHHTMEDVQDFAKNIEDSYGIQAFQIHIHRDEGKSRDDLNYHAHILWDWQDKKTGKSFKLNRKDISMIQDLTASSLGMVRGELKENSNRERLEAVEYKRQQEQKRLESLQEQIVDLEQKKNEAIGRYQLLEREDPRSESFIAELAKDRAFEDSNFEKATMEQLERAVELQRGYIEEAEREERELEDLIEEAKRGVEVVRYLESQIRDTKREIEANSRQEEDYREAQTEYESIKREYKRLKEGE